MRVSVESLPEITAGSKGLLLRIRNEQGGNIGKLWIGKAHVRWAPGNVPEKNAKKLAMQDFVNYLNQLP